MTKLQYDRLNKSEMFDAMHVSHLFDSVQNILIILNLSNLIFKVSLNFRRNNAGAIENFNLILQKQTLFYFQ